MAEILTDGLVRNAIQGVGGCTNKGYPDAPNKVVDDIVWYEQNGYKGGDSPDPIIEKLFSTASKSGSGNEGRPEFIITTPNFFIVFEDKDFKDAKHSSQADVSDYIGKGYIAEPYKYAIDDVLRYVEKLKEEKDVIAIANTSNGTINNFKTTTFYMPKNGTWDDLHVICNGGYDLVLKSASEYQDIIDEINGIIEQTYEELYGELSKYVAQSAVFMEKMNVEATSTLELVSFITLALSNTKSNLYKNVKKWSEDDFKDAVEIKTEDVLDALIGNTSTGVTGIIRTTDETGKTVLPQAKYEILKQYAENTFNNNHIREHGKPDKDGNPTIMNQWDYKKGYTRRKDNYFEKGYGTILSRLICSIYENVTKKYDKYKDKGIDVMGTFYSLLSQFYKGDAKKGVVLTPVHITDLFCDLAEYFSKTKFTEKTKILDICTGSGGFLISALRRINTNIENNEKLNEKDKELAKIKARKEALIGNDFSSKMFVLAYVNMLFHKDGSSQLCNHDGLKLSNEKDFRNIFDMKDNDSFEDKGADIGMINPPYDGSEYDQLQFISAMLSYLKKDGIGIAIVPPSNQGISRNIDKAKILEQHTLLASILMPSNLFWGPCNSGAAVGTCILVFKAHQSNDDFIHGGGKAYLADWREDGFKVVNKHGRFEDNNRWKNPQNGYRKMYIDDMKSAISNDYNRLNIIKTAYKNAFGEEQPNSTVDYIPSSFFKPDIHKNGIKSTMVEIHTNPHAQEVPLFWTRNGISPDGEEHFVGDPKYVYKNIKREALDDDGNVIINKNGKPKIITVKVKKTDEAGEPIQETKTEIVYDNEDWNILNYVKTDYHELLDTDFIKTIRNYRLFQYMLQNDLLFNNNSYTSSCEDA